MAIGLLFCWRKVGKGTASNKKRSPSGAKGRSDAKSVDSGSTSDKSVLGESNSGEGSQLPILPKIHPLVVGFVAFHVLAVVIYTLPKPIEPVLKGEAEPKGADAFLKYNFQVLRETPPVAGYLLLTGFWQYWDMFAPEPSQTDLWASAEVTYLDGSVKQFKYPRIKDLPIPEKYVKERYRKFYERVNQDDARYFWPPFGRAIAVKSATDPLNPPVRVDLIRHFQSVVRHDAPNNKIEPPYTTFKYYHHVVDQNQLAQSVGWSAPRPAKFVQPNTLSLQVGGSIGSR
jgi:hypothetical protein